MNRFSIYLKKKYYYTFITLIVLNRGYYGFFKGVHSRIFVLE